ncbi:hypothetical protein KBZ21_45465, partial [Streptomyces sp. A73]|nr:hypothetical protein [Streptomyces sp. A73]
LPHRQGSIPLRELCPSKPSVQILQFACRLTAGIGQVLLRPTGLPLRRRQLPLRVLHRPDGGLLPLRSLSSHIRRGL